MQQIAVFFLYLGILLIVVGYVNQTKEIQTKIEYRYIPKTFEEEQENLPKVSKIFNNIFEDNNVWLNGARIGTDKPKKNY
jgi:hypothetical protein